MARALNWIMPVAVAAFLAGAAWLWLKRGDAMLLDLSSSIAAVLCL